ncbi:RNA exonuclease 1 homolog isoform X2 [Anthonomus grandis grandis]|uniref:RNA exonuclease 1 homolog isoform X2 n=1 Tax=Anthonomus grandis grandis TaxID=2921223 RepID=UPI002165C3FB|nr:RNA exonuclease 1 homolog isoform X2 [Anthonomus grandis grandis]
MLPTKGYFQDIECPFYNTTCGRPYCHFRHKRKPNEIIEEPSQEIATNTVPTYKPTPKSELASIHSQRSHIPISYVPDLSYKRERTIRPIKIDKPTYKPTPLSILSSATQVEASESELQDATIKNIQENIASNVYDPQKSEINFEALNNEFEAIDNIIESEHKEPQNSNQEEHLPEVNSEITKEQVEPSPLQPEVKDVKKTKSELFESVKHDKTSKSEDLFDALKKDKSVEIKKEAVELKEKSDKSDKKESKKDSKRSDKNHKDSKSSSKSKHSSSSKEKSTKDKESKSRKESEEKRSERSSSSHHKSKERDKHQKEDKKDSSKSQSISKDKEKHKSKDKKRSKTRSESTNNSETESSSTDHSPERHRKEKKKTSSSKSSHISSSNNNKQKIRDRSKEKSKKKSSRKSKSRSRSRSKSKEKHKHRSSRTKHEDSKSKNKEKERKSKDRESKSKSSSSKEVHENKETPLVASKQDNLDNNDVLIMDSEDVLPEDIDFDLEDEDETLKECYRIFTEYKPEPIKKPDQSMAESRDENICEYVPTQIKKRTAHAGAELSTNYNKLPAPAPPKPVLLPGQILTNRYKIAKLIQAKNEQESIINEIKTITQTAKRPATSLLEAARMHKIKRLQKAKELEKPKNNIVDDILNGVHKPSAPPIKVQSKKIAAVPNVALIEKAKERISLVKRQREENVKTIAHTTKGSRVAHVPEYTLDEIPDVLQADKSKLPVNVRTRFLTMIAEECAKLYASKDDAYNRALNEEFSCYEKCKVLATYRNSAMLAVNRLRKEVQERDAKGLGRLLSGESSLNKKENEFEGKTFYNNVKRWILTDEELDIHGYPRESSERGVAIINNRTEIDFSIVDENQRKCSRCGKLYQVDDDGWPLYDEECMYHPMKKRTIRREQVYLCCKSSEETGCAMSDTHVFDGLPKHLLEGYQTTFPPESDDDPRSTQVYALDCEMCYTTKGLELTRVTVVDTECKTVYESLVKPLNPIIDYNTRFSGITKDQMDRTGTNILQVQANILHLCNSETILVGHSLESDMKALKIIHGTIVDTSVLFPHKMGLPHKKALRALASEYLQKIIQNDVSGHDSAEDAIACMDLIKWKLKEELKTKVK